MAQTSVDPDRAITQCMVRWDDVKDHLDENGKVDGQLKRVPTDKKDRVAKGRWQGLPCRSGCTGEVELAPDGSIDAAQACPVHMLKLLKALSS